MKTKTWLNLVASYRAALSAYAKQGGEEDLQRGYELGRRALELGLGVLDIIRLHQEAAREKSARAGARNRARAPQPDAFLMEALSPFEVAQRGFRDACERLTRLNFNFEQRNAELAAINAKLAREIALRRKAKNALEDSELKFRSVVESAQDGIITVDRHGRLVAFNRGAEVMFGYRREDIVGKPVTRLIPRPMRAAAGLTLRCLMVGEERDLLKRPLETCGLRRDGTEFSVELTLATWHTRSGRFFTGVVRDITERKRTELALRESREHYIKLFNEARTMEEDLRQLSNKILTAQEEERRRISRELHDEIGQLLTAANVSIAMLRQHAGDDLELQKKVLAAQRLLEGSIDMVHRFARELRPSMLDHLGAYAALLNYVKAFTERTGIKIEIESDARLDRLNPQQGTVLYRVAQESLTNVYKHARATRVKIRLSQLPRAVRMEIKDNGRSIPPAKPDPGARSERLGLLGMQERVRLVHGQFAIESAPRRGTTVRVEIPFAQTTAPTEAGELQPRSAYNHQSTS